MDWIAARATNFARLMMERDRLRAAAASKDATAADKAALARADADLRAARSRMTALRDPEPAATSPGPVQITATVAPSIPVGHAVAVKPVVPEDTAVTAQRLADEIIAAARLADG